MAEATYKKGSLAKQIEQLNIEMTKYRSLLNQKAKELEELHEEEVRLAFVHGFVNITTFPVFVSPKDIPRSINTVILQETSAGNFVVTRAGTWALLRIPVINNELDEEARTQHSLTELITEGAFDPNGEFANISFEQLEDKLGEILGSARDNAEIMLNAFAQALNQLDNSLK